ncbi:MAG: quinolinate synthase [Spirochaetae bacterium HGW-Spirochaetae-4]|nr:MAG: quinolinate synthase [Spirochaetae bacterium HGW-Spirochaetae-4]
METMRRIISLRKELGERVIIPAHHYQKKEITDIADFIGDSYRLAVDVSTSNAEYILFCGVHFMAEGAAVLAKVHQKVVMPNLKAGCPMADMITYAQAEQTLENIRNKSSREIIPVVYMNAHAHLKAFCGQHEGSVCTSSNARKILEYYLSQDKGVLFFPDQHLGRNTAMDIGLSQDDISLIDKESLVPMGNQQAKVYLWDGSCPIHQEFNVRQIETLRRKYPGITVIVHPEVNSATALAADMKGSTEYIYNVVSKSPPGSVWAIGTEYNFVSRLAYEYTSQGKTILPLETSICTDMSMTTPELLLETLEQIRDGNIKNKLVTVDQKIREDAKKALQQMIAIVEGGTLHGNRENL